MEGSHYVNEERLEKDPSPLTETDMLTAKQIWNALCRVFMVRSKEVCFALFGDRARAW